MAENIVNLEILAGVKNAVNSINSFKSSATKSLEAVEKSFNFLKGAAVAAIGIVAGSAIVRGLDGFIEAAKEAEDSLNEFNTALALSGIYSKETSDDFQKFAEQIQNTTKVDDDAVLKIAALIQSLGQLSGEGLKGATKAAIDLSAALRIDLNSAATLVGKAAQGEIGTFTRYGVVIKKGANDTETFANVLKTLNTRFGGSAAAQINTYSGATQQLDNAIGNVKEAIGNLIIQNPMLITILKESTKTFTELKNKIEQNKDKIAEFINKDIIVLLKTIPVAISVLESLVTAFEGVVLIIPTTTIAFTQLFKAWEDFEIIKPILGIIKYLFEKIGESIKSVYEYSLSAVRTFLEFNTIKVILKFVNETIENLYDWLNWVAEQAKETIENLKKFETINSVIRLLGKEFDTVKTKMKSWGESVKSIIDKIVDATGDVAVGLGDWNNQEGLKHLSATIKTTEDAAINFSDSVIEHSEAFQEGLEGAKKLTEDLIKHIQASSGAVSPQIQNIVGGMKEEEDQVKKTTSAIKEQKEEVSLLGQAFTYAYDQASSFFSGIINDIQSGFMSMFDDSVKAQDDAIKQAGDAQQAKEKELQDLISKRAGIEIELQKISSDDTASKEKIKSIEDEYDATSSLIALKQKEIADSKKAAVSLVGSTKKGFALTIEKFKISFLEIAKEFPTIISDGIKALEDALPDLLNTLNEFGPKLLLVIPNVINSIIANMPLLIEAFKNILPAMGEALVSMIKTAFEQLPAILTSIADLIPTLVKIIFDAIVAAIKSILKI